MRKLLFLICAVFLLGCTDTVESLLNDDQHLPIMIDDVQPIKYYQINVIGVYGKVYVDSATRVEYLLFDIGNGAGLTQRVDSLGKPILYTGKFPE